MIISRILPSHTSRRSR